MGDVSLFEHAANLIMNGEIEKGEKILVSITLNTKKLERAWAWLYARAKTDEQRIACLEKIIALNPDHKKAKLALEELLQHHPSQATSTPPNKIIEHDKSKTSEVDRKSPTKLPKKTKQEFSKKNTKSTKLEKGKTKKQKKDIEKTPEKDLDDVEQIKEPKSLQQNKEATSEQKSTLEPSKIEVKFIDPKVIYNSPNENLFKTNNSRTSQFPEVNSGMYGTRLLLAGCLLQSMIIQNVSR